MVDHAGDGTMTTGSIGHNSGNARIAIEIRLFNSLAQLGGRNGPVQQLELGVGATVGDAVRLIGLPLSEIFLVLRNGRDVSPGRYEARNVNTEAFLDDGDVVAFSGPVPYSFGYGAPVV
jgi:hypothetical protein